MQLQAAAASPWPPGVLQPSEEQRPRRRFGARDDCGDGSCDRDHGKKCKSTSSSGAPAYGADCHCDHVDRLIADAITDERLFRAARADLDRPLPATQRLCANRRTLRRTAPSTLSIHGIAPRRLLAPARMLAGARVLLEACH